MGWGHSKVSFLRARGPILTGLGIDHPWGKGLKFVQMKGMPSSGDNSKTEKIQVENV
jgi:hypothetical protein